MKNLQVICSHVWNLIVNWCWKNESFLWINFELNAVKFSEEMLSNYEIFDMIFRGNANAILHVILDICSNFHCTAREIHWLFTSDSEPT